MKVVAIGTSCTWFERNNTSFLIDDEIVFDMPAGNYKPLIKYLGIENVSKIKCILISHFHSDHFSDFHILTTRLNRETNPKEKYVAYGPTGILDRLLEYNRVCCGSEDELNRNQQTKNIDFFELHDGKEFKIGKYNVVAYEMSHGGVETYGFTFDDGKVVVGFSSDTAPCENLNKILRKSNYVFIDVAAMTPHKAHICIDQFEKIVKDYPNVKFYPIHTSNQTYDYLKEKGYAVVNDNDKLIITE